MSSLENLSPTTMPQSNSSHPKLPDDLLLSCIARVARSYYPTLSLVSKRFRSLVASPELYKALSLLGHSTESCLYVCLKVQTSGSENYIWFTLRRKPNQGTYVLAKVPISHPPHTQLSTLVAVGSNIYDIGGTYRSSSSNVSILDCPSPTWRGGPSLRMKLISGATTVVDGKIYVVAGSYIEDDYSVYLQKTLEVFDTKTKIWDPLPIICNGMEHYSSKIVFHEGKLHVVSNKRVVAYDSNEVRWDFVGPIGMNHHQFLGYPCEIGNVLYSVAKGVWLMWFDIEERIWREIKGLEELPKFPLVARVELADYGGKMAVLWDKVVPYSNEKMIWCAEITLERRENGEIWGKVEWFEHVLTVPKSSKFVKVLGATF